jgi:preprotein translocase subunit YajC
MGNVIPCARVDASGPKVYPSRPKTVAFIALTLQPTGPKAGTPAAAGQAQEAQHAAAPAGAQPPPSMGIFGSPIFLMLLFLPFIFMMWRRNKKETEARSKLKKGDKVLAGGLIGEIVDVDERIAKVKIAPGVTVQALASSLSPLEDPKPAADGNAKDVKDAKAAKSSVKSKDEVASKPS